MVFVSCMALAETTYNENIINIFKEFEKSKSEEREATEWFQKGIDALHKTENYDMAIKFFKKAIAIKPNYSPYLQSLGSAYEKKGMLVEAINEYRKAIDKDEWSRTAKEWYEKGEKAFETKNYDEAIKCYKQIQEMGYEFIEHYWDGLKCYESGKLDEAISEFEKAIAIKPNDAFTRKNLGSAYKKRGMLIKAINEYKKTLDLDPRYLEGEKALRWFEKGEAALKDKNYNESVKCFERALWIPEPPSFAPAHRSLGASYAEKGKFDKATAELEKAINLDPDDDLSHYSLGFVYQKKEMFDEAISEYKKTLAINPNYAEAHLSLGASYSEKGMNSEAFSEYKKAININPNYADAYFNLGILYYGKGMLDDAIEHFKKAIAINPNNSNFHLLLGSSYKGKKMIDEAISEYKNAINLDSDNAWAHQELGLIYFVKLHDSLAADYFYKACLLFLKEDNRDSALKSYEVLKQTKSKELEQALFEKLYPELKQKGSE